MRHSIQLAVALLLVSSPLMGQSAPFANPTSVETQGKRTISLYADGNVRSILESKDVNSSATGSIGLGIQNPYFFAAVRVTAAGTNRNITEGFGGSLLTSQGGGSFSGFGLDSRWLPRKWNDVWYGVRGYFQASSADWANGKDTLSAPMLAAGGLITLEFRDSLGTGNPLSIMGDIGIARRQLRGDVALTTNDAFRAARLGSAATGWTGLEIGLTIQLHQISARGAYYQFGDAIRGFSKGQIVTSISVQSSLFSNTK